MKTLLLTCTKSLILASILLVIIQEQAISQNRGWIKTSRIKYGMQINQIFNGSGHGLLTDVDFFLKFGHNEIAAGVFTQINFDKISGASLQYKYFVTHDDYINLYAHCTLMYHYKNCLTDNLNQIFHPQDYSGGCEYEKYNTLVNHVGIGVETKLLHHVLLDANIGIGYNSSRVVGVDMRNKNIAIRDDAGFAASASLGIVYQICVKNKKMRFGNY